MKKEINGYAALSIILGFIALITGLFLIGSIFGIVSITLAIIALKKCGKHSGAIIGIVLSVIGIFLSVLMLASINDNEQATANADIVSSDVKPIFEQDTAEIKIEYDALQQLYLDLEPDMSYTEMIDLVKSTGLPYSEQKYNGSRKVQVAFTEGCTVQEHKKESGDYLAIYYEYPKDENSINDELEKYSYGTCAYVPCDSRLELINHVSGYYFSYYVPGNYISKLGKSLDLDKEMSKEEQLHYYLTHKSDD